MKLNKEKKSASKAKKHITLLVFAALFAAIIFVGTYFFQIPLPTGYANLGDAFIIIGAYVLGPIYGFFAAAIGSGLTDLVAGYGVYAPATFIIKGLMAVVAYFIVVALAKKMPKLRYLWQTVGCIAAEILMVGGYFIFEQFIMKAEAVASIPGNCMQGLVGLVISAILINVFSTNKTITKKLNELR